MLSVFVITVIILIIIRQTLCSLSSFDPHIHPLVYLPVCRFVCLSAIAVSPDASAHTWSELSVTVTFDPICIISLVTIPSSTGSLVRHNFDNVSSLFSFPLFYCTWSVLHDCLTPSVVKHDMTLIPILAHFNLGKNGKEYHYFIFLLHIILIVIILRLSYYEKKIQTPISMCMHIHTHS